MVTKAVMLGLLQKLMATLRGVAQPPPSPAAPRPEPTAPAASQIIPKALHAAPPAEAPPATPNQLTGKKVFFTRGLPWNFKDHLPALALAKGAVVAKEMDESLDYVVV